MRTTSYILSSFVLSTALVACSPGNTGTNNGAAGQNNGSRTGDTQQGRNGNATMGSGSHMAGQQGQYTVSMTCLQNLDQSGLRQLGLNEDQTSRMMELKHRSAGQQGAAGSGQGGQGTSGQGTSGQGTNSTGTQGSGNTGAGGNQGSTPSGIGGTAGSQHGSGSANGGQVNNGNGAGMEQGLDQDLRNILTNDQMAALGRMCDKGNNNAR